MSIGPVARKWFSENYRNTNNKLYTSKYYTPEESWPKTHVWWFQIPLNAIDRNKFDYVNLVCQVAPGKNAFHYLKVPTKYLNENLDKFHMLEGKVSLYLSANPKNLFLEERGIGSLNFRPFLII